MFRTRFTKTAVSMLAAALLGVLTVVGCSDDDDNGGGGGGNNSIVNAHGEAWVSSSPLTAAKFHANGVFEGLDPVNNGAAFFVGATGTWTTNGSNITISYRDVTLNGTYSISGGNTLNVTFIGETHGWPRNVTLTRTPNVTIVDNPYDDDDDGDDDNGIDSRLANAPDEVWTVADLSISSAIKLHANGVFEGLNSINEREAWYVAVTGTWTTSGNRLTVSYGDITEDATYSMPDNNTLHVDRIFGFERPPIGTYIRTPNVTIVDNPYN